jgi:hypothetical protein
MKSLTLFAMTLGNGQVNPDPISVKKPKAANSIRSIRLNRSTDQWAAAFSQFATTSHDKATVWLNTGGCDHDVRVEVVCVNADGGEHRRRVLTIERRELAIETLNRSSTEGKSLLAGVSSDYGCVPTATSGLWKHAREDAFGLINVPNPRWKPTRLPDGWPEDILSDENLAHGQSSPEMLYLETKWASLIPFVRTADLLRKCCRLVNPETVRNHLQLTAGENRMNKLSESEIDRPAHYIAKVESSQG